MKKLFEFIGWFSGLVTLIATVVTLVWFFFGINSRIEILESQVQAIYQSEPNGMQTNPKENGEKNTTINNSANSNQMSNLTETCATLALRTATAYENGNPSTVASPLEKMMEKLGCDNILKK